MWLHDNSTWTVHMVCHEHNTCTTRCVWNFVLLQHDLRNKVCGYTPASTTTMQGIMLHERCYAALVRILPCFTLHSAPHRQLDSGQSLVLQRNSMMGCLPSEYCPASAPAMMASRSKSRPAMGSSICEVDASAPVVTSSSCSSSSSSEA